jgi:hypothetical protein
MLISDSENAANADPSRNVVILVWNKDDYPEFLVNSEKELGGGRAQ